MAVRAAALSLGQRQQADAGPRGERLGADRRDQAARIWAGLRDQTGTDELTTSWTWISTWLDAYGGDVSHRFLVVIEAPAKSGALITVDFAADYGREVFAVPGSVLGEHNRGSHRILRDGARLVTSAADVVQDLGMSVVEPGEAKQQTLPLIDEEQHLLNYIRWVPQHIDEIAAAAGVAAHEVAAHEAAALSTMLELKGAIKDKGSQQYARV